jgi:HD-like signal output (HDOD) protein
VEKRRILFVDDEPKVLQGLERMLRNIRHEWEMAFAESGQEALHILGKERFHVVVSDMRMPGMDGAQLLTEVMNRYPESVRIILSGQSSPKTTMKCVRSAHQFLSKPCDADIVKSTIERACALRDLFADDSIKGVISQMESLPSVPSLYTELMEELELENASIGKIGEIIARDVGMTAKMLQLVNSAFFGFYQHVTSPVQAVSLLGLETIKGLVLSLHIFSEFDSEKLRLFSLDRVWKHSVMTGLFARAIAKNENQNEALIDDALTAALLHDSGKLVLASNLPDQYSETLTMAEMKTMPLWEAERVVFGVGHSEVGAYLMGLWGLPDSIVETLAFHHDPKRWAHESFTPLTAVHVANVLEHETHGDPGASTSRLDSDYLDGLGVSGGVSRWREVCRKSIEQGTKDE